MNTSPGSASGRASGGAEDLQPDPSRTGEPGRGPGAVRVLVVDDQVDVLATTAELFRMMGYEVLCASNGVDAVGILRSAPGIEVLFSDVVMPGMNGVMLALEARKLNPGIQVILASGFQASVLDAGSGDLRDYEFLAKPFRLADLATALRK